MIDDPASKYGAEFYNYPITRFGAYFTGVLFGIMYFEWMRAKKNPSYNTNFGAMFYNAIKNNGVLRYGLLLFSSAIMVLLILSPRLELVEVGVRKVSQIPSDIFNTFHRTLFVGSMGLFLSGAMVGRMSFMRGLFGGKLWAPWAKITFTAYLLHIFVLCWLFFQNKGALYITIPNIFFYSFTTFLITVILSVPVTLVIESPILQLERLLLFPPKLISLKEKEGEENLMEKNLNFSHSEEE